MNDFDIKAATWDMQPERTERAKIVADRIIEIVQPDKSAKVIDFGCGTGLLGFNLAGVTGSMTMADTSRGMLDVVEQKIKDGGYGNVHPLLIDESWPDSAGGDYDLVVTLLAIHHVEDISRTLNELSGLLKKGGILCIVDLEKEDGSFHGEGFKGHLGFRPEEFARLVAGAGLKVIRNERCCMTQKQTTDGVNRDYPMFIIAAEK